MTKADVVRELPEFMENKARPVSMDFGDACISMT